MKKILVLMLLLAAPAFADNCGKALTGPAFSPGQANSLCKVFGGSAQVLGNTPTLAATPVAGTNMFLAGLNVVSSSTATHAAFLGKSTPVPGERFVIVNNTANIIRAKAAGGATLNGATAGGYIAIAALATVECVTASSGNQICQQPVIPTPAGP